MTRARRDICVAFFGLTGALVQAAGALAQEPASQVLLPWQKPQQHHTQPNFKEILPWLLGEDGAKTATNQAWHTEVSEPVAPREPEVSDPAAATGTHIETGAITPSGLVLKTALPSIKTGKATPIAAETGVGAGGKIKNSFALPGDRPVDKSDAVAVPSVVDAAEPAPDVAGDVAPTTAAPVAATQIAPASPADAPLAHSDRDVAPAAVDGPEAAAAHAGTPESLLEQSTVVPRSAREVPVVPKAALSGKPADPKHARPVTDDVAAVARAANVAIQEDVAAPASSHDAVGQVQPVGASPLVAKPGTAIPARSVIGGATLAQATMGGQAPQADDITSPVETAPALPAAEEAPPIPDPLPEAVVTPVPVPAESITAKEITRPPSASPAAAPAAVAASAVDQAAAKPELPSKLGDGANAAKQYCFNIADAAKDARYAWQKKTLADIEAELNKRIALLDERTAEYQKWLARRDEFIRTAEENVVKIYAGMKPDIAATQLALMNEESAAAVLAKLSTRNASAVLNEMEPAKAAKLTMIITGAAKLRKKREQEKQQAPASTKGADAAPGRGSPASAGGRS